MVMWLDFSLKCRLACLHLSVLAAPQINTAAVRNTAWPFLKHFHHVASHKGQKTQTPGWTWQKKYENLTTPLKSQNIWRTQAEVIFGLLLLAMQTTDQINISPKNPHYTSLLFYSHQTRLSHTLTGQRAFVLINTSTSHLSQAQTLPEQAKAESAGWLVQHTSAVNV